MPFARVPEFGDTVMADGAAPEVAFRPSQLDVAVAVQFRAPVPVLET